MHACMRMNWAYLPTLISPTKNQLESCIYLYLLGEMRVGKTRLTHVYMNAVEKRGKGERARRVGERGREEGRDRGRERGREGERGREEGRERGRERGWVGGREGGQE